MRRISKPYLYLLILESTSIPLALLFLIFILSGYGMVTTAMERFGLNYRVSSLIHTSKTLRILLITITYLHMVSGFGLLIHRYIRCAKIRLVLEALLYASVIATLIPMVICEAQLR